MYFKNPVGKVYITKDSVVVEKSHSIQEITPKPNVDKETFLEMEYYNQVETLHQLAYLRNIFGQ